MKKRALVMAAALAWSGASFAQEVSDDVVKIAVLTDMSGTYSDLSGQGGVVAAEMAIADFGGKVLGKKIELISADHQNKADVAATKAREWFDAEKVDMIAGLVTSSVALAVQEVGKQKNRMTIVSGAGSSRITGEDCAPTGLHWTYDTYALAVGTGNAVVKEGGDTWFFLTADYAFGQSLENDVSNVVKAKGGKVLGSVRHPFPASDFSSYLLQAQASGAKVIGLANAGNDTMNAIKQANEFGIIDAGQQMAGLLVFITDVHSLGLETAKGLLLTTGFYWDFDDQNREWSKRFFEKHKAMPTMVHAGVYSSVLHYLKGIEKAGTDAADKVVVEMRNMPVDDFFGRGGKLREDGRMVHDMYLAEVKKPADSKSDWDYYNIKQVIPGDEAYRPMDKGGCPLVKK